MIIRNGLISGKPALLTNTTTATITAAQMNHQTHVLTAACDLTLPMATVGLDAIFYANSDFEFAVVPGTADYCILNGTTLKIAQGVVSDGKAFSCVRARCLVAGYWTMTTLRGTISANSLYTSTTESPRISAVATGAFLDNLSAGAMAVIAANPLLQVDVYYGSTLLRGYTGLAAVGTGETTDSELVTNGTFTTDTTGWVVNGTGASISVDTGRLKVQEGGALASARQAITTGVTSGALFKFNSDGTAGTTNPHHSFNVGSYTFAGNIISTDNDVVNSYKTVIGTSIYIALYTQSGTDKYDYFDNVSILPVTAPSTSGCLLYSDRVLSVQSPLVNTFAAGSYNQSAYTVILSKPR